MNDDFTVGKTISGKISEYKLTQEIGGGANSSFKAHDLAKKIDVFLKIYNQEPRKSDPRFKVFWNQQKEISKRLQDLSAITDVMYEDFLIDDLYYCSVKEFVQGKNLARLIEEDMNSLHEKQVLGLAAVFVGVLKAIHSKGVTHTDLKPGQLFVTPNRSIGLGWELKVKDFDAAHVEGVEPYNVTGTAFYLSPEHMKGDKIIRKPSDVFTTGIILAELLTGAIGSTFDVGGVDDGSKYNKLVMGYKVNAEILNAIKKMYLEGDKIADLIHTMLNPDPAKRPLLDEVHPVLLQAFKSNGGGAASSPVAGEAAAPPLTPPLETSAPEEAKTDGIVTVADEGKPVVPALVKLECDGQTLIVYSDKTMGRDNFRIFPREKFQYASKEQFSLKKSTEGWMLSGSPSAINPTKLNGEILSGKEILLKESDQIQVGTLVFGVKLK
ncbi:MAG: protein kinase [Candidatus Aminicenantes bacterium]|nr:protein kinase [Candidatus Aminicenantes bacterium]